ncbi:MAG: hypothetical protein V4604_12875 [Bacteroidota bacterium]
MKLILSIVASLLLLLMGVNVQSCKKDTVEDLYGPPPCDTTFIPNYSFDTVYPSDYIMAYPGSWWEYNDGYIDSCFNWTTVSIVNNTYSGNCVTVHEDKQILPRTKKLGYFSFETQVIPYATYKPTLFLRFISLQPGEFLNYHRDFPSTPGSDNGGYETIERNVVELLDSMVLDGITYYDIIHTHEYHSNYWYHIWGGPHWTNDFYFAKDIGLVKQFATYMDNPTIDRTLVSHFIAPH